MINIRSITLVLFLLVQASSDPVQSIIAEAKQGKKRAMTDDEGDDCDSILNDSFRKYGLSKDQKDSAKKIKKSKTSRREEGKLMIYPT